MKFERLHLFYLAPTLVALLSTSLSFSQTNPDPGSGEIIGFVLKQAGPAGHAYDPLVSLPGRTSYVVSADRTGMLRLSSTITHTFSGTITTTIRDADGTLITTVAGDTPAMNIIPVKYRFPLLITVISPDGDPVFTGRMITGRSGYADGPGYVGSRASDDPDLEDDEETEIPQESDEGDYGEDGKAESSGECGSCEGSSCDLTNAGDTEGADANGDSGRFLGSFTAGTSMQGDSSSGVDVEIYPSQGVSRNSFKSFGTGDAQIGRLSNGSLSTIQTSSCYTKFEDVSGGVKVSISKNPTGVAYRTVTYVNTTSNVVTRTSTFSNKSITTTWKYEPSNASGKKQWTIVTDNGARKHVVIREDNGADLTLRVELHKLFERSLGSGPEVEADIVVSEVRKTFRKDILGWRKTKTEVYRLEGDPLNALTTVWEYFGPSDGVGKAGLLKSVTRPDGSYETHTYSFAGAYYSHNITRPFAGAAASLVETRKKTGTVSSSNTTTKVGTSFLSQHEDNWTSTTLIRSNNDGSGNLTTSYSITSFGLDFGGLPTSVQKSDGSRITQSHDRTGGSRNLTVVSGEPVGAGIGNGVSTATTRDQNGVLQSKYVTATGANGGTLLNHFTVGSSDSIGRPTAIEYFPQQNADPAWTINREFACCGLLSETDKFGVPTYYKHDDSGRRIRINRQGVTHATAYDGLTVSTHRYAEDLIDGNFGGNPEPTNQISSSTRDQAAIIHHSWERSPETEGGTHNGTTVTGADPDANPQSYTDKPELFTTTESLYRNPVATQPNPHDLPTNTGLRVIRRFVKTDDDTERPSEVTDYHLDGRILKSTGDMSPATSYSYSTTITGLVTTVTYLEGTIERESTTTQYDWVGRVKSVTKGGATTNYFYGNTGSANGNLVKITDPDNVSTLYSYNLKGERTTTAIDVNNNNQVDIGGPDRVTISETVPGLYEGSHVWTTTTNVYEADNDDPVTPILTRHVSTDGLREWSIPIDSPPSSSVTNLGTSGNWTHTVTQADGNYSITTYVGGLMDTSAQYSSDDILIASTTMRDDTTSPASGYDSLNRPTHRRESQTGLLTTAYLSNTCDFVKSVKDAGNRITLFTYDHRGRRKVVDAPDTVDTSTNPSGTFHNVTSTTHDPDGSVRSVTGAQNYPVSYTYDYAGRMKTMTTYRSETQSSITAWNYSTSTGLLLSKRYDSNPAGTAGTGPTYEYTDGNRLWKRFWARPISESNSTAVTTIYGYTAGLLASVTYNDDTPDLVFTHDRLGRVKTVIRANVIHAEYTYAAPGMRLSREDLNQDTGLPKTLLRDYDTLLRPDALSIPGEYTTGYGYDTAGRLNRVWHHPTLDPDTKAPTGTPTFTYGYTYTQENSGAPRVGATTGLNLKQDFMPYTLTRGNGPGIPPLTTVKTYEGTRNALKLTENRAGGPIVSSFAYIVNAIGQRESVTTAGIAFASTPANWGWHYDSLGQVVRADHAGTNASDRAYQFDTIGNRLRTATGTLDLPTEPNWIANALNQYTTANGVELPASPAPYDADGNLAAGPVPGSNGNSPGVQAPANATEIRWDAENRLISVKIGSDTYQYEYDHYSRLITMGMNGTVNRHFVYDGWNRIAEYSANTLIDTFTWGLDLSGSMQGAGGVGGLLATRWVSESGSPDYFPTYDGNGNISEYLSTSGTVESHYEYDPFGTLTLRTGSNSTRFQYRFSTKPRDVNTGLYYYGYRYYDPLTGRWPSRDPIGERGGVNLYGFLNNSSITGFDHLGQQIFGEQKGDCYHVSMKFKIVAPVNGSAELRKLLIDDIDSLGKMLTKQLNEVFSGKECCCIRFAIKLTQATSLESLLESDNGINVEESTGSEGEVDSIEGKNIESISSTGLLNGRTFPHEVGHLLNLRHPHPQDITDAQISNLVKHRYSRATLERIRDGEKGPGINVISKLMMKDGYDPENEIRDIDPEKNIMSWGTGKDVNCDQINQMIESVKKRSARK
jgi:RHS repeat-associated protein